MEMGEVECSEVMKAVLFISKLSQKENWSLVTKLVTNETLPHAHHVFY